MKSSPQLTQSTLGRAAESNDNDDDASVCDISVGGGSSSAAESPHPSPLAQELPLRPISPQYSRSSSPIPKAGSALSDHAASPVSFGYPYHQCMSKGLFDTHTATAIQGSGSEELFLSICLVCVSWSASVRTWRRDLAYYAPLTKLPSQIRSCLSLLALQARLAVCSLLSHGALVLFLVNTILRFFIRPELLIQYLLVMRMVGVTTGRESLKRGTKVM